jgi:enoyl-CoA hydratase/carnithine racemase
MLKSINVNLRRFSSVNSDLPLIIEKRNCILSFILNRPKAFNALSLEMCTKINKELLNAKTNTTNSEISAIITKSNSGKAFCAGGDVKLIWQEIHELQQQQTKTDETGIGKPGFLHTDFFTEEYKMNYLLGTSNVPQISLWDGIVMGGGVGLSVLGEFRIATEKTLFAMPETGF